MSGPSLAAFLGPGLARVAGAGAIARRIAAAAVLAGLAASPLLVAVPASAAGAVYERIPQVEDEAAVGGDLAIDPSTMRKLLGGSAPFVAAALRHGIDPERFLTIALVARQLRDESVELGRARLAPVLGRKDEAGRMADPVAARWLDLVARHGREVGAATALDALQAAQAMEAGKRRKPVVEAVMRRIVEMRGHPSFEAEILAREYVAVRAALPDGFDRIPVSHAYVALAFGPERLFGLAAAIERGHGRRGKGRDLPAHKLLGVPVDANGLFTVAGPKGKSSALSASDFVEGLDIVVERLGEVSRRVLDRDRAEAPTALGAGLA